MKHILVALFVVLGMAGCATTSEVTTVDDRARLVVYEAPVDAVLYVDGLSMGMASNYSSKKGALAIESGTHEIEIRNSNRSFYSERVFLGPGILKTVVLR